MATLPTGKGSSWSISRKAKGENNYGIGITFVVEEDIDKLTDFRMTGSKSQYFTFRVSDGKESRDLKLPSGAMVAFAAVMPEKGTWKGQKFIIDGVEGTGFETKTIVRSLGLDQQRKIELFVDATGKLLAEMKKADAWDSGSFSALVMKHVDGDMAASFKMIEKLKTEGKITDDGKGTWKAT